MGKTAQILCTAFYCGPAPALTPNAPPKWKGCTNKHQSKTSTDALSVNINAPYEQFIWVLAFSNSANTWKCSGLTYLKAFLSLHTSQACGSLETDRPQDQHPCSTPWDQPDGKANNLSWRPSFQQPQPLLQVWRNLLLHVEDAAIYLQAKESHNQEPVCSKLRNQLGIKTSARDWDLPF